MRWPLATAVAHFLFNFIRDTLDAARRQRAPDSLGCGTEMVKCPRCFLYVPADKSISARVEGNPLNFCSVECLEAYRRDHGEIDPTAAIGAWSRNKND